MNALPTELLTLVVRWLQPTDAVAVAQTSRQLAARCAEIVLHRVDVDLSDRGGQRLARVLRRRFAGVAAVRSHSPVGGVIPFAHVAAAAPATQQLELWGGSLGRVPTAAAHLDLQGCTQLALCPYGWRPRFHWPLERWATASITTLRLNAWGGSPAQWTQLIAAVPALVDVGIEECPGFDAARCGALFDGCRSVRRVQITDCAPALEYRDVLRAAARKDSLEALEFSRTYARLEEGGGVTLADVSGHADTLQRLRVIGICDSPLPDAVIYWLYENCPRLALCYSDGRELTHQLAATQRMLHHPDWCQIVDCLEL